jgi:hypothetical protein
VPLSMEWNVPSACAPTVHARTNYWIGTEQKILFLCVSVSVSGDSLSLCSPRCWLHVTCAIWTKDLFFFFRASLGTHSNRARRTWWFCCWPPFPKELLAKHLHIQPQSTSTSTSLVLSMNHSFSLSLVRFTND